MIKLKKFQPELVTPLFPEPGLRNNPARINKGHCMQWAYMAYRMFEGAQLWSMPAHAFIRYQDNFYDSERLEGVEDWKDLPACNFGIGCGCRTCKKLGAQRHKPNDFKKQWSKNYIKPDWSGYRLLVQFFVEKESNHETVANQEASK